MTVRSYLHLIILLFFASNLSAQGGGTLKDSLAIRKLEQELATLEVQYKNGQAYTATLLRQLEIAQQKKITNQTIAGALFLLLLLTAFLQRYFFRQDRKKRENEVVLQIKQLEVQKSKELEQSKSHFFTNLSQELRAPLNLILGTLKKVGSDHQTSKYTKEVAFAQGHGERLLSLINKMTNLSQLDSGKLELHPTQVAILPFLRQILRTYEPEAAKQQIELLFESELEDDLFLQLDRDKVESILHNLLSNALQFSSTGDEILMEVQEQPAYLSIKIIDSGIGISEQDLPNLFNRFYPTEQSGRKQKDGIGIGLALAKALAKLHGGDIQVESQLGMGSTFTLLIPFKETSGSF